MSLHDCDHGIECDPQKMDKRIVFLDSSIPTPPGAKRGPAGEELEEDGLRPPAKTTALGNALFSSFNRKIPKSVEQSN
jgi:hypothetical protein